MKKLTYLVALVLLFGFSRDGMSQGVIYELETTYHSEAGKRVETAQLTVLSPHLLMMEILSGKRAQGGEKDEMIFRGDRREVVVVDHSNKAYMVMDEAAVNAMGEKLGEVKQQMQNIQIPKEALARLPEAERKRLEALMKQQMGEPGNQAGVKRPAQEYRKTGERATREGYPCVRYDMFREGVKVQEMWVTDADNVEGGKDVRVVFKEMADFYKGLMDAFSDMMGGGLFGEGNDPLGGFAELDGFPVVTRDFEDGSLESETVLRSARRQMLDPDAFEPPSGYKRQEMFPGK